MCYQGRWKVCISIIQHALIGHGFTLQVLVSVLRPSQSRPPNWGSGLLHSRCLKKGKKLDYNNPCLHSLFQWEISARLIQQSKFNFTYIDLIIWNHSCRQFSILSNLIFAVKISTCPGSEITILKSPSWHCLCKIALIYVVQLVNKVPLLVVAPHPTKDLKLNCIFLVSYFINCSQVCCESNNLGNSFSASRLVPGLSTTATSFATFGYWSPIRPATIWKMGIWNIISFCE